MNEQGWGTDPGATPPPPPPPPSSAPGFPPPPGSPPPPPGDAPLPPYGRPAASSNRGGIIALVGAAAVAVLLAGVFAVTSLTAADGADSPEAAVEDLFAAVSDEDAIGVLESLAPGEREMLVDPVQDIAAELARLDVTDDFDLGDVPGLDLEVEDLQMQTVRLTDDISRVEVVGGTLTASAVPAELPVGSRLGDEMDDELDLGGAEAETEVVDLADAPFELVTIERDGAWHVSLAYTIADAARVDSNGPSSLIGQGPVPVGSESPEAAVRDMADAIVDLPDGGDSAIERLVSLLPPDELGVAYDYLPLWLGGSEYSGSGDDDEFSYDDDYYYDDYESSTTVEISDLVLSADGGGSVQRVRVDGFAFRAETTSSYTDYDGEAYTSSSTSDVVFDGECVESTYTYESSSSYSSSDGPETETVCKGDASADDESLGLSSLGSWSPSLTVVEVDGRWYVSPVRSLLDSVVEALRAMSPEDLQDLADSWSDGFFGGSFEAAEGFEEISPIVPEDGTTFPLGELDDLDDLGDLDLEDLDLEDLDLEDLDLEDLGLGDLEAWAEAVEACGAILEDATTSEDLEAAYEAYTICIDDALGEQLPQFADPDSGGTSGN